MLFIVLPSSLCGDRFEVHRHKLMFKKPEKNLTLSELFPVTELHLGDLDSIHENAHLSKCHGNLHQIRIEVIIQGRAKGQNR